MRVLIWLDEILVRNPEPIDQDAEEAEGEMDIPTDLYERWKANSDAFGAVQDEIRAIAHRRPLKPSPDPTGAGDIV